jgi:diguanylate cyclase (GGDEF)-like protein
VSVRWNPRLICALLLVVAVAALPASAVAVSPDKPLVQLLHEGWSAADGLPQSAVQAVRQTSDGYLWVGTQAGLARFDGAHFEVFDRYNTPEMVRGSVSDLAEGPDGTLWITLQGGGVLRYSGGRFEAITMADGLASDLVWEVEVGADGTVWIGSQGGLDKLIDGRIEAITHADGRPLGLTGELELARDGAVWMAVEGMGVYRLLEGDLKLIVRHEQLPGPHVESIAEALDGTILVGTTRGLVRLRDGNIEPVQAVGLPNDLAVTALSDDPAGALWLGTRKSGLWRIVDGHAERYSVPEGLTAEHVVAFFEDREGSLWIGTLGGGLNRLRDAAVSNTPAEVPWAIREDAKGRLWVGGSDGLLLLEGGRFVDFEGREQLADAEVGSLLDSTDGSLWIGTLGTGLKVLRDGEVVRDLSVRDGLPHDRVFSLAEGPDGAVWAGTGRGLVRFTGDEMTVFSGDAGLPDASIRALHFDRDGLLWICSDGQGCATFDGTRFQPIPGWSELPAAQGFAIGMHEDESGALWFATDGGLLRYSDQQLTGFTRAEGMAEDSVYRVLEDDHGYIWTSGDRGVFRVARRQLEEVAWGQRARVEGTLFGRAQGMRWVECNGGSHPAGWKTRDGILHFPTIGGLVAIDPTRLSVNEVVPPVHIQRLWVDGREVEGGGPTTFPPGSRRFLFDYTALSFVGPEQVRFRTMLEGLDAEFTEVGNRRSAYFHTLPPGRYTFRVLAANSDGLWNEEGASYSFSLEPYLWERRGFRAVSLVALALLVFAFPAVRIRRLKQRERELASAVEERTRELRELSLRDPLTGLRNRRFLWEVIPTATSELAQLRRGVDEERRGPEPDRVTGFLMVDIDHFKQVNDTHGHAAGDAVLRRLSQLLEESVRSDDIVVRWGGEEFLLVLRRTRPETLAGFADRLRLRVVDERFEIPGGDQVRKSCSVGVCCLPFFDGSAEDLTVEQVIAVADAALYRAKETGRDRIIQVVPGPTEPRGAADLASIQSDLELATVQGLVRLVGAGD